MDAEARILRTTQETNPHDPMPELLAGRLCREDDPVSEPRTWSTGRLDGRVAIVTGAARGIGRAAAVALAGAGAHVVGVDACAVVSPTMDFAPSTEADLERTGVLVREHGVQWRGSVADQRDISRMREVAQEAADAFGGFDIVFANAGIQAFRPLLEMEDADWDDQIEVNLTGTANVVRAFAPHLVARGGGRLILTSSTQGQHGTLDGAAYSASKWGIIGLMKSAALELGRHGITVNAVVPGLIDTALTRHEVRYAQAIRVGGGDPTGEPEEDEPTARAALAAKSPLGVPWIDPDAIAPLVVFLAGEGGRMISGTTLAATAGDSANITA